MSNLLKNLVKEDWWSDLSSAEQAAYIKRHPGSQKAQAAAKKKDEPKSDKPKQKPSQIKPIKKDKDTKRMGDSLQRRIGGSRDPDRLEVQGTQKASNGETIIQYKDKSDGSMVGVDAQGNIYEDGEKQNYGVDVSTQSDVFGADKNQQLRYKQKKARETGGQDPYNPQGMSPDDPMFYDPERERRRRKKFARTGKELSRKEAKQFIRRNKMKVTEDVLRKVIREEIRNLMEADDFDQPIPAQIERYLKKFLNAVQGARLNRRRVTAILGRVVKQLNIEPSELMRYVRKVKKGI